MSKDTKLEELRLRYEMTKKHIAVLGRDRVLIRMIPEGPKRKGNPWTLTGTIEEHYKQMLPANRQGRGIFVQVNESDGSNYRDENIVSAPCLFADFDKVPIENLDRFPIRPHLIIETSPGKYHAYWRVSNIPLDRFSELQRRLADLFGSDPLVHDLPRLMRLAGFYHMKNPDAPHLVRIIEL